MLVTLDEAKEYLRVDFDDDNSLIESLSRSAQKLCMDIVRTEDEAAFEENYKEARISGRI